MRAKGLRLVGCVVAALLFIVGCQSDVTLSSAVRKGDTLTVSLGDADLSGADANVIEPLIRAADVTAEITDINSVLYTVKVRHVFRVFGDPTAVNVLARNRGQWMAVIDLVTPTGPDTYIVPNLAVGAATISLTSAKFDQTQIVHTRILAGEGTPHKFVSQNESDYLPSPLNIDKLGQAVPAKQAFISIQGNLPQGTKLAGAEYRFVVPAVSTAPTLFDADGAQPAKPAKLGTSKQIYFEFKTEEMQNPVSTEVLVVMTSSEGLEQEDLSAFNYVMTSEQSNISSIADYWVTYSEGATYYDTDGEVVTDLMPDIGLIE